MARESKGQKDTVSRVMHEFKHGELASSTGKPVKSQRQAVAIALHEAGASNEQTPEQNRRALSRTKSRERKGETAQAEDEGKSSARRKPATKRTTARKSPTRKTAATKKASRARKASARKPTARKRSS